MLTTLARVRTRAGVVGRCILRSSRPGYARNRVGAAKFNRAQSMDFRGRLVLITGAAKGIGAATAKSIARGQPIARPSVRPPRRELSGEPWPPLPHLTSGQAAHR
jgi:hypothetical protein